MFTGYCWRSGQIGVCRGYAPAGTLPVGRAIDPQKLIEDIQVLSRHAYDGRTLLVPGLPEAETELQVASAVVAFQQRLGTLGDTAWIVEVERDAEAPLCGDVKIFLALAPDGDGAVVREVGGAE